MFNRRVAFIAAALYALDPFLTLYSSTNLYSDSFFVFFLVAGFWFFSLARHNENYKKTLLNYGLCSFFLGLATLTRPISMFIIACFIVFYFLAYWKHFKIALTYTLLSSLVFSLTLFPWFIRNYLTFGYFSYSSASSANLLEDVAPMKKGMNDEDIVDVRQSSIIEVEVMMEADGLNPQDLNAFQKGPYWQKLAVGYISKDPVAFGKSYFKGVFNTLFSPNAILYADYLRLPAVDFDVKAYPDTH